MVPGRGSAPVGRYLVIDRWASAAAYVAFLSTQGEEYERRNRAASALYSSESVIGRYEVP